MGWWTKLKQKKDTAKILIGVSKVVLGGNQSKILSKVEEGTELTDKAFELADLVKDIFKKKK